jgi:hypothetical protein
MEELVLWHALAHVDAICYNYMHRCITENDFKLRNSIGCFAQSERPPVLIIYEQAP